MKRSPGTDSSNMPMTIGLMLFASSWFVRVHREGNTLSNGSLPGLQALLHAWVLGDSDAPHSYLFRISALSNVVVLALLLCLILRPNALGRMFLPLFASFLINLIWLVTSAIEVSDLRAGYYAWTSSFLVLAYASWRAMDVEREQDGRMIGVVFPDRSASEHGQYRVVLTRTAASNSS